MAINSVTTLLKERRFPSPPPSNGGPVTPLSTPRMYPSPDFPFRTYVPPNTAAYAATTTETAIVIDNGASSLRAGFSNLPLPSPIVQMPPLMARYRDRRLSRLFTLLGSHTYLDATTRGQTRNAFEPFTSIVTNWDVMEGLLDYTFLTLGCTGTQHESSIDHPIVMTEPLANLPYTRRTMTEVLFEAYGAPSVTYGIDSLFSYRHNNRGASSSGLIISSSHTATHIIPVLHGKPALQSSSRLNWGGSQAAEYLMKLLRLKYPMFPGKLFPDQMSSYIERFCYISPSYSEELSTFLDWSGLEETRDIIIQYPFTEHILPEKSPEELARIAERKRESGRRLQEQAAKMRLDKLIKREQQLEYYKHLHMNYLNAPTKKEQRRLLDADEFRDEASLERVIRDLEKSIRKARNKDLGGPEEEEAVEEQSFPLLDVPDDQLDEAGIKDKRHQRLMKSGVEARQRAKAEKERERARVAEEERLDEEKRVNHFDEWVAERRSQRETLLAKIKDRERARADQGNRKSLASQMRMKTLANLASDGPKRKRRGGGDADDDFGANDDDWGVYRTVATHDAASDDEGDAEEDPVSALKTLESDLLKYDPGFEEKDTLDAQNDWTTSLVHAFLRGARPSDPESQREAHQVHLNVERIRVPEVVFQPGIAGVDQAGLAEIVEGVVMHRFSDPAEQALLLQDIFLTGGATLFHGFEERLAKELRAVLPSGAALGVRRAGDAVLDAWRGAAGWWADCSSAEREVASVSRAEYAERGAEYVKEHAYGNSIAPSLGFGG